MRIFRISIVVIFAALVTGCVKFATTPVGAKFSALDEPSSDHAIVYIYRPKSPPYLLAPVIEIDGVSISELPSDGYIKATLPAGKHSFVANWDSSAWMSDPDIDLVTRAGKRYFVGLGSNMRMPLGTGISNQLDIVLESEALPGLSKCGVVKVYNSSEIVAKSYNKLIQPTANTPAD